MKNNEKFKNVVRTKSINFMPFNEQSPNGLLLIALSLDYILIPHNTLSEGLR